MKNMFKILLLLSILLGFLTVRALANNNVSDSLKTHIQEQVSQAVQQTVQKADRPWQVVIFSLAEDYPEAMTDYIESFLFAHPFSQRVVLVHKEKNRLFITEFIKKPFLNTYQRIDHPASSDGVKVLHQAFGLLDHSPNKFYTGVVLDAHGSGYAVELPPNKGLSTSEIFEEIKKEKLKIDVLELESCMMGSLATLYYATETNLIDYLIVAPTIFFGNGLGRELLTSTQFMPAVAATNTVEQTKRQYQTPFSMSLNFSQNLQLLRNTTFSCVLYHLPKLRGTFKQWALSLAFISSQTDDILGFLDSIFQHIRIDPVISSATYGTRKVTIPDVINNVYQSNIFRAPNVDLYDKSIKTVFKNDSILLNRQLRAASSREWCLHRGKMYTSDTTPLSKWPKECLVPASVDIYQLADITAYTMEHTSEREVLKHVNRAKRLAVRY